MKKNSIAFLCVLFVLYFIAAFYTNYVNEMQVDTAPEVSESDLASCSINELDDDRIALTIPATYVIDATQETLDATASQFGYEKITLNEDKSATYYLTHKQHEELLSRLHDGLNEKLSALPGKNSFKDVASVSANDIFTDYTVKLSRSSASYDSSMIAVPLKSYSTMYNVFRGIKNLPVHITFYNDEDKVIAEFDS